MTALRDFDLGATLECGQCFRWDRQPDGSYRGTAGGKALCVSQDHMEAAMDDPFWRAYFDLDRDYAAIREALSASSPVLAKAASFAPGIRILQQDRGRRFVRLSSPRTTTSPGSKGSFRGCAKPLARRWSKGSGVFHRRNVLPAWRKRTSRACAAGFRARYILDAARKVASGEVDLEALRAAPLAQAREQLMAIVGVGPKVADCALLYGLHRLEAFPMDVWMKRAMKEWFPGRKPRTSARMPALPSNTCSIISARRRGRAIRERLTSSKRPIQTTIPGTGVFAPCPVFGPMAFHKEDTFCWVGQFFADSLRLTNSPILRLLFMPKGISFLWNMRYNKGI